MKVLEALAFLMAKVPPEDALWLGKLLVKAAAARNPMRVLERGFVAHAARKVVSR